MLLQYRAAAAAGFGCQLFWGLIRMMIFTAFYENADPTTPMSLEQVVTYVWLGQAFIMLIPFRVDSELDALIRTGNVAYELLRPVDLYNYWFARSVANRTAPTLLRSVPMLIVAALAGWVGWPGTGRMLAFTASLGGAVLLTSAITMLMNISMFWTISGQGVNAIIGAFLFILSGMIVPLPLFPDWLQPLLKVLPFRGMCDVPFRIYSGNIPIANVPVMVLHQLAWVTALIMIGRCLLWSAKKRLAVQGG